MSEKPKLLQKFKTLMMVRTGSENILSLNLRETSPSITGFRLQQLPITSFIMFNEFHP